MRKTIFILIILGSMLGLTSAQAYTSSSFEFMLLEPSARASAMGEAFTAVSGDAGAQYFNPASAALMKNTEFSFMHIKYLTDATLEQFSFLTKAGKIRFGLGLNLGKIANIARYGDTPTDNPSYFDEHNFTGSIFFAAPIAERFSAGFAAKIAYEKLDLSSATALATDLGLLYSPFSDFSLGASVRNLGTKAKFDTVAYDLPREFRLGVSYRTPEDSRFKGLLFSSDFVAPHWGNRSSKLNFGGEYAYQNLVALRLGYCNGYDSRGLSVGGGLAYQRYYFDYAFVPSLNNLGSTHRFTLRIRI